LTIENIRTYVVIIILLIIPDLNNLRALRAERNAFKSTVLLAFKVQLKYRQFISIFIFSEWYFDDTEIRTFRIYERKKKNIFPGKKWNTKSRLYSVLSFTTYMIKCEIMKKKPVYKCMLNNMDTFVQKWLIVKEFLKRTYLK
jgi:hypothetical protein